MDSSWKRLRMAPRPQDCSRLSKLSAAMLCASALPSCSTLAAASSTLHIAEQHGEVTKTTELWDLLDHAALQVTGCFWQQPAHLLTIAMRKRAWTYESHQAELMTMVAMHWVDIGPFMERHAHLSGI